MSMNAVERAVEMMKIPTGRLPLLALAAVKHLSDRV
jgi:hypothetical protein